MQHGVDSDMLFMSQLGIPKTKPLHIQPIQGSQEILYNISYPAMDAAAEAFFIFCETQLPKGCIGGVSNVGYLSIDPLKCHQCHLLVTGESVEDPHVGEC